MKVKDLMTILENMPEEAEVKIGLQPNYPLQATVKGVWNNPHHDEGYPDVYILANESSDYFSSDAWNECEE